MQAVGMVAEFNPLHKGHVHALTEARRQSGAEVVVVALAGNYTQRGEPAIVDKWARTQAALANGADLVIELPTTDAVQAASQFATGGVTLLAALGVTTLAFGTEAPTVDYARVARTLAQARPETDHFQDFTQTYATQLNTYYRQVAGVDLSTPNLMLGMSYAQANFTLGEPMRLLPLARVGAGHDDQRVDAGFASGSRIRQAIANNDSVAELVPAATKTALTTPHYTWQAWYPLLRYRLLTADLAELRQIDTMTEGLEYRLTQQIATSTDFASFMQAIKSKRYTYARLRRLCLSVLLNLTQAGVQSAHHQRYLQVLGFTPAGRAYLHSVKKQLTLPLITRVSAAMLAPGGLLYWQQRADSLIESRTCRPQNYGRIPLM